MDKLVPMHIHSCVIFNGALEIMIACVEHILVNSIDICLHILARSA